ncbi:MAG: septum site-determining protein MinC [Zoogloeaceae bacterium]|nr:septum site-determining protein MinC [Zoogloeaceae bacterium]
MPSVPPHPKLVEFQGATLGVLVVVMRGTEPAALADALHKMMGGMGDFFSGEAAILDFSPITAPPERIDWTGVLSLFRRYRLQPIGVRGLPTELEGSARQAGLANLPAGALSGAQPVAPAPTPQAPPPPNAPAVEPPATVAAKTMVVDRYLRTGQQIYAKGCDLILVGGLSNGAEVIADGNIHCYGPLRGRAIAGAQGDTRARIFSSNFGPELVAIAGVFRTFEKGIPEAVAAKGAQVRLNGSGDRQKLDIDPLQLD